MCFYPLYRRSSASFEPANTNNTLVAVVHVHVNVESGGTWESAGMLQLYQPSHPLFVWHQTMPVGSYTNGRSLIQFNTISY